MFIKPISTNTAGYKPSAFSLEASSLTSDLDADQQVAIKNWLSELQNIAHFRKIHVSTAAEEEYDEFLCSQLKEAVDDLTKASSKFSSVFGSSITDVEDLVAKVSAGSKFLKSAAIKIQDGMDCMKKKFRSDKKNKADLEAAVQTLNDGAQYADQLVSEIRRITA